MKRKVEKKKNGNFESIIFKPVDVTVFKRERLLSFVMYDQ